MKFAEMPYQRVDTDAVVAGLKELTQELKAAKSGEEQFAIHQKFYELRDEYSTMIQIAMIRSDVDTADAFYSEEKDYYMKYCLRSAIRRLNTEKYFIILHTKQNWKRRSEKWHLRVWSLNSRPWTRSSFR